jgi:hypothetical protein
MASTSIALARRCALLWGDRALAVDYSENGRFGKNGLNLIQHGLVVGISLRW